VILEGWKSKIPISILPEVDELLCLILSANIMKHPSSAVNVAQGCVI
jgi:hypothetical protein